MAARALMFQGTGSDVGKSLIVAGLCRAFRRRGIAVRPFKPQNMSNNAAVTADGGEIGRAQALQARACGVPPLVDMNPVLLKPQGGTGAQIVVHGRVVGQAPAREYQSWKPRLLAGVLESFRRLATQCELLLVEGAGSAAEVNLRENDIANMGFAEAADVPVVLIGDIDRGGVFAQVVGTRAVLAPTDAARVRGFLINKFRGDPTLFRSGMQFIAERSGWPALGLIPYFDAAARLPAEDSMALARSRGLPSGRITVAVPLLPSIANFDDLDPLRAEPGVTVAWIRPGEVLPADAALVILPGSKATMADLSEFRRHGWDVDLAAHIRRGGRVFGICGGYQMLGRTIADPHGVEGPAGACAGLGHLAVNTVLTGEKALRPAAGTSLADGAAFTGYEMHMGETTGADCERPLVRFADGRTDGAVSADGNVRAAYVHGVFAHDAQRAAILAWIGAPTSSLAYELEVEAVLDRLAAHLETHVDVDALLRLAAPVSRAS